MSVEGPVLIDTSAFFAMANSSERRHEPAKAVAAELAKASVRLYTTNFIRAECHALILNRLGHQAADKFLEHLGDAPRDFVVYVSRTDEMKALDLLQRYRDKDFSLVDATSFVVMERLKVPTAFCFDDDFRQYGRFHILP